MSKWLRIALLWGVFFGVSAFAITAGGADTFGLKGVYDFIMLIHSDVYLRGIVTVVAVIAAIIVLKTYGWGYALTIVILLAFFYKADKISAGLSGTIF